MASIRKIEKTGHWEAQIFLGKHPETGKARFVTKTCDSKKDAAEWVNKIEVQKAEGLCRPALAKVTLAAYLIDTWLPRYHTQVRSTYTVEMVLRKWICRPQPDTPFLGNKLLRKLTVADFDKLYAALAAQGMQLRGIQQVHALVRRALKSAVVKGELPRNPTDGATIPKPNVRVEIKCEDDEQDAGPVQYMERDQAERFLTAARVDRLSALWYLLLDSALRPGEAFALKWRHIDFERGVVKVRGTLVRVRGSHRKKGGEGWIITDPKTESSKGDVPLSLSTMQELRRWKVQQNKERLQLGSEWRDEGFVFTTPFGTPLGNNTGRVWTRLLKTADRDGDLGTSGPEPEKPSSGPTPERSFTPKFSMYVLRHTRLTLLYEDTKDILLVSRFARHKNITITSRFYVHTKAENSKQQAAESFGRLTSVA
jgi:integrase